MSTEWLPPLILLEDSGGDWGDFSARIYAQFQADFVDSTPIWPGKRVGLKRYPEYDGKSATFWHFISEGDVEKERLPDLRRCERIAWPRKMIDEFDGEQPDEKNSRILWWMESRRDEARYLLAPDDFSYIVVVADRGDYVLPWTAFFVRHEHQRRKRAQAYRAFWGL